MPAARKCRRCRACSNVSHPWDNAAGCAPAGMTKKFTHACARGGEEALPRAHQSVREGVVVTRIGVVAELGQETRAAAMGYIAVDIRILEHAT
jgi:hypothetical protein